MGIPEVIEGLVTENAQGGSDWQKLLLPTSRLIDTDGNFSRLIREDRLSHLTLGLRIEIGRAHV